MSKEPEIRNSFYIEGLWLNGAIWSEDSHSIDESEYSY